MTQEDAVEYVTLHADTNSAPALTESEVTMLVGECAIVDVNGVAPSDEAWEPTYWLPKAVASAWELRAARAALWVNTTTDGTSLSSAQAVAALERNADRWRRRCVRGA